MNKDLTKATPIVTGITNFPAAGTAQRWQLTDSNVIAHLTDIALANGILSDTLPSQSITLFILPAITSFSLQVADDNPPDNWASG